MDRYFGCEILTHESELFSLVFFKVNRHNNARDTERWISRSLKK